MSECQGQTWYDEYWEIHVWESMKCITDVAPSGFNPELYFALWEFIDAAIEYSGEYDSLITGGHEGECHPGAAHGDGRAVDFDNPGWIGEDENCQNFMDYIKDYPVDGAHFEAEWHENHVHVEYFPSGQ